MSTPRTSNILSKEDEISTTQNDITNATKPFVATAQDLDVIADLNKKFYPYSQTLIEKYYLQPTTRDCGGKPLPQKSKIILQDGVIEREVHGGMHAGRVQQLSIIWHEIFKEMFPDYIQKQLIELKAQLGLNEVQILCLIRYTALMHDAARLGEGRDEWEKESGKLCSEFFRSKGLSLQLAKLFSKTISLKDWPADYMCYLRKQKISKNQIEAFDYLRKLINFADCADILRCTSLFQMSKLNIKAIAGYKPEIHDPMLLDMIKTLYQVIRDQKDMLTPCHILLTNDTIIKMAENSCYDLKAKVKLEHASNVCYAILENMKTHAYFAKYLKDECSLQIFPPTQVTPAFNPLVHGTNSFLLSTLEQTNLNIVSPVDMVEHYGIAPMGGEITKGGLRSATEHCNPCFGRMNARDSIAYSLEIILTKYTTYEVSKFNFENEARKYLDVAIKNAFYDINVILVFLARANQLDIPLLSTTESEIFTKQLGATIQVFYLFMLLGSYIHPDVDGFNKLSNEAQRDTSDAVYTHLTFRNLINNVLSNNLNIKEIYENPTADTLLKVLDLLQLPERSIIKSGPRQEDKEVTLALTQIYTLKSNYPDNMPKANKTQTKTNFSLLAQNASNNDINTLLERFIKGQCSPDFFTNMQEYLLPYIAALTKKLATIEKLVSQPSIKFSNRQNNFLKKPFPLLLICEAEEKLSLIDFRTQEYRASGSLKIGQEILMIATDTKEHQLQVMEFLADNHIYNTQVVLFEQLIQSKKDLQRPQSAYAHADGFPKLSWFATNKIQAQNQNNHTTPTIKIHDGTIQNNHV